MGGRFQHFDQFLVAQFIKIRQRLRRVSFRSHTGDVAVIWSCPFEGGGAFPGGLVNGAHAIDVGIGGAIHFDELLGFGGFLEGGTVGTHGVTEGAGASPVDGEGSVVPFVGEAGLGDVNATATRAAAVVGERSDGFFFEVLIKPRIAMVGERGEVVKTNVPAATIVSVVPGEHVEGGRHGRGEDVAGAGGVELKARAVGTETDHAAATMLQRTPVGTGGFHESKVAACDVDPSVDAQSEVVGGVVGGTILEAEGDVGDETLGGLRNAITIAIEEDRNVRRVEEVKAVVIPDQSTGRIDIANEFRDLIGASVLVFVAQTKNATSSGFTTEGAVSIRGDIKVTAW